jgi:transcription initiation factor TFIID TATA-box-binding protein
VENKKSVRSSEVKIANVVATVTLTEPLDLVIIHERLPQTEFPGKSPWLKLRLKPDNIYTAFYKSGKFLITTKDPKKIDAIAHQVLELLHSVGLNGEIVKTEIHNVVVQTKIPLNQSLESIIVNLDPKKASFEPEQFPALIYKNWGVSYLLFSTGSCIVSGLKDVKDAEPAIELLKQTIGTIP